jgi:hypothetical protein
MDDRASESMQVSTDFQVPLPITMMTVGLI